MGDLITAEAMKLEEQASLDVGKDPREMTKDELLEATAATVVVLQKEIRLEQDKSNCSLRLYPSEDGSKLMCDFADAGIGQHATGPDTDFFTPEGCAMLEKEFLCGIARGRILASAKDGG